MSKTQIHGQQLGEALDASEDVSSNPTNNPEFNEVVRAAMSRRSIVQGSLAGAAATFLAPAAKATGLSNPYYGSTGKKGGSKELVGFEPLSLEDVAADYVPAKIEFPKDVYVGIGFLDEDDDLPTSVKPMPSIADEYEYQVFIPWGTPIEPGITEEYTGDFDSRPTPEQAELQIGVGHDGMWFFPMDFHAGRKYGKYYRMDSSRGMLCINHEFGTNPHVLGKPFPESLKDVRLSQAIHGVSVIKAVRNRRGKWRVARSKNSRRITPNTPVKFTGPAAHSPLLQNVNGNIPLGTVNNCGSGPTPWGTYLTCEENFNGYFGYTDENYVRTASQERYGFSSFGFGYGWYVFDKRWDISDPEYANESNRFGWIVEIDPFDGTQKPCKRTAMGRFKHEAVAIATTKTGRAACYMGDDQRGDYCYKYISDRAWEEVIEEGKSPLDEGKLYVARFNDDGTGDWLLLSTENPALNGLFEDQGELLINTRLAADAVGATKMDRPEWTTIGTKDDVYWTLTNNDRKQRTPPQGEVNAANPEDPNTDGHIIRTVDDFYGDGETFTWEIYLLASETRGTPGVFTDPDAAYADPFGRLFIGTDGGQPDGLQDQLTVFDLNADEPKPTRMLVGVSSDEVTGWATTPDYCTAFTNLQHPGDGNPANTSFPAPYDGKTIPRDATLILTKKDGGVVGS